MLTYADRAKQWPQEFRRISARASTSCTKSLKIAYAMSFVSNFENFEAITQGVSRPGGGERDDKLSGGEVVELRLKVFSVCQRGRFSNVNSKQLVDPLP